MVWNTLVAERTSPSLASTIVYGSKARMLATIAKMFLSCIVAGLGRMNSYTLVFWHPKIQSSQWTLKSERRAKNKREHGDSVQRFRKRVPARHASIWEFTSPSYQFWATASSCHALCHKDAKALGCNSVGGQGHNWAFIPGIWTAAFCECDEVVLRILRCEHSWLCEVSTGLVLFIFSRYIFVHVRETYKPSVSLSSQYQSPIYSSSLTRSLCPMFRFVVLSQLVAAALGAIGPIANVHVANKVIQPDGFSRSAVLAGANPSTLTFPGPVIRGLKGLPFYLNVQDDLTDATMLRSTSIHWHGFFQAGSAWADGPAGVTQCPISPGHSFLYKFSTADQAGTFWYHSHHLSQYCDGLRGAMVVYDLFDPHRSRYSIDNEATIITLADWYHTPAPSAGIVPTPDSTLINGKGRYAGGPVTPLTTIVVKPNRRYRFRLVSISCDPNYTFSIDGHTMTIIEVDSVNIVPITVDSIQIFAGQRYSFVLNTNQLVDNYWIRANPNLGTTGFAGGLNSAILRYDGAGNTDPTSAQIPNSAPLLETNLHPLTSPAAPGVPTVGAADVNINLDIVFDFAALKFRVNGALFEEPSVPVLLQILSGTTSPAALLPAGSIYSLPKNKVVEISMPGGSVGSPHPIHLHGHAFSVVRSAGSSTYNYANPVQRDVVNIGDATDNVTIRFKTDNPGPWIMHCHIDWHLVLGLSVVFAEDVPTIASSDPPTAWDELCPIYDELPHGTR